MSEFYGEGKKLPLTVTNPMHFTGKPNILEIESFAREQNNPSLRNDGNDVNLDYEMSEMAKTVYSIRCLVRLLLVNLPDLNLLLRAGRR